MNGKGLSMMTMDMFSVRAPNGGKALFKVLFWTIKIGEHCASILYKTGPQDM